MTRNTRRPQPQKTKTSPPVGPRDLKAGAQRRLEDSKKLPRSRPPAIMVSRGAEEFPELLRTVRSSVNPTLRGDSIAKMRRTQQGNLLIEINGGAEAAETVRQEISHSLGPDARVRRMGDESTVEVLDLDELTTKEEVLAAIAQVTEGCAARLVSLRQVYGNAQTAVVVVPVLVATRLCVTRRIKVGLVYARIRRTELPSRCYRYLAFGHFSRECTRLDRSKDCWSCGVAGHFGHDCAASPAVQSAFRAKQTSSGRLGNSARQEPTAATTDGAREGQTDRGELTRVLDGERQDDQRLTD